MPVYIRLRTVYACRRIKGRIKELEMLTRSHPLSYCSNGCSVTLALFRDVKNCAQLKSQASTGRIPASLLDTALLCSEFHVLAAVNKAVTNRDQHQMRTKNIYSEIIYCLSPSTNISESFKNFGIQDSSDSVLVVLLQGSGEPSQAEAVLGCVEGEQVLLEHLAQLTDHSRLQKVYKISAEELAISSLENSVVTKIASRDIS